MFYNSLVGSEVWLGATDADTEGEWLWAKSKTPVDAINWSVGQPDDNRGREDCMLMMEPNPRNRRAWNDDQCVKELNYVCEMPKM